MSLTIEKTSDLLSMFDFVLCSEEEQLQDAYKLRMIVFHDEQGFPADTEVDEYDPISAHFNLVRRQDKSCVATVRLTPYPRKPWLAHAPSAAKGAPLPSPGLRQDETSVVTSGGGPGGTAGGLPIFSSSSDTNNVQGTKSKGVPAEAADDRQARQQYPLGRAIPAAELAQRFQQSVCSTDPIDDESGAPQVRGAKVSRLAVARSARGTGLGALVMRQVERWLVNQTSKSSSTSSSAPMDVVISSQMHAKPFYEKLGYAVFGEPYEEEGAPHCWCVKRLSGHQ